MLYLKLFQQVAVLRLLGDLFQVLDPTYNKVWISNFDLRKGNYIFFVTRARGYIVYRQQDRKIH